MKMLKVEELSIGDWVNILNYHWDGRPYTGQVSGIMKKPGTYYLQFGSALSAEIDICEPIPITEEILEKNGFYFGYTSSMEDSINNIPHDIPVVIPEKTWCYDEGDGEITIDFPTESDGGSICISYADKYMELIFDDVVFLHELQHALKLCGILKNIEL